MEVIVTEDQKEIKTYCRQCYDDGLYEKAESFIGRDLLRGLRENKRVAVIPGIGWCLIYKSSINQNRVAIYVAPNYRRQGYGGELYAAATLGLNVKQLFHGKGTLAGNAFFASQRAVSPFLVPA